MALRWMAGLCVLALAVVIGYLLPRSANSPSADLGIAARLGYERVSELRRTTSPEYREAKRQLARAERVAKRVGKKAGDEASDQLDELLAGHDRMLDLGYAGRWEEATEAAAVIPRFGYEGLLGLALKQGAPVDMDGHNALTIAAEYFYDLPSWEADRDSLEPIDFLLANSVTTKPTAGGLDALDRILLGILNTPRQTVGAGIDFLRHLIDRGAPVELSHREVAQMISASDTDAHARLIEAVPELL